MSLATATIIQNLTTAILAFVSQHYFIGVVCLAGPPPLGSMGLTKILWIALVAAAIRIITEDLPQLTLQGIFIFQAKQDPYILGNMAFTIMMLLKEIHTLNKKRRADGYLAMPHEVN